MYTWVVLKIPNFDTLVNTEEGSLSTPTSTPLPSSDAVVSVHGLHVDFREQSNIDLTEKAVVLASCDFVPETIGFVSEARLATMLNLSEGRVWQFKDFAAKWVEKRKGKEIGSK